MNCTVRAVGSNTDTTTAVRKRRRKPPWEARPIPRTPNLPSRRMANQDSWRVKNPRGVRAPQPDLSRRIVLMRPRFAQISELPRAKRGPLLSLVET